MDFRQAFDRACHSKLKHRLLKDENLPAWLRYYLADFLSNRKKRGEVRTWERVVQGDDIGEDMGCVQGSVLGPALWFYHVDILLKKLVNVSKKHEQRGSTATVVCYVDDVSIVCSADNKENLKQLMQEMADTCEE